jgi:hypothetical protein
VPPAAQILENTGALDLFLERAQGRIDAVAVFEMNLYHLSSDVEGSETMPLARHGPTTLGLSAKLYNVLRRRTLLALHDVELDLLSLGERLEAAALDRRMMHEAIFLAAVRRDETETLLIVEPLDRSNRTHCRTPDVLMFLVYRSPEALTKRPRECEAPFS